VPPPPPEHTWGAPSEEEIQQILDDLFGEDWDMDVPAKANILDELERYRQMGGPMPDIGRAMEDAARELGLRPLEEEQVWKNQRSMASGMAPWPEMPSPYPDLEGGSYQEWPGQEGTDEWRNQDTIRNWPNMNTQGLNWNSLIDVINSPGFKIGGAGTAILGGLLSYIASQVAEEVVP
jgi:hypothetical protein